MVLIAYGAHQAERLGKDTYAYQLLNLCGGALLVMAAITTRQAGLILMEGAWTVLSAYRLVKLVTQRR